MAGGPRYGGEQWEDCEGRLWFAHVYMERTDAGILMKRELAQMNGEIGKKPVFWLLAASVQETVDSWACL